MVACIKRILLDFADQVFLCDSDVLSRTSRSKSAQSIKS